jgi:hypothetical protein
MASASVSLIAPGRKPDTLTMFGANRTTTTSSTSVIIVGRILVGCCCGGTFFELPQLVLVVVGI